MSGEPVVLRRGGKPSVDTGILLQVLIRGLKFTVSLLEKIQRGEAI